ncbi:MAG: cold shock protein [Gaiellaceae bacterium]|jgi:CspA family cold shock protein|nr:cold shock protein [Gaiellaceae bacterium]
MATGTVTWVDPQKGCGFVAPDSGGKDLFIHSTAVAGGSRALAVGAAVEFELHDERDGRIVATNVALRTDSPA